MIDNSEGRAVLSTYSISAISNSHTEIQINPDGITMRDDGNTIILNGAGIILPDGDHNRVLTSNGSTINIANYLQKSDVSGQFAAKADRADLIALKQKVTANTTAIEGKQDKIIVEGVDVTDIETDDITKLRTIVKDLIDALSKSGLIRKNINLE